MITSRIYDIYKDDAGISDLTGGETFPSSSMSYMTPPPVPPPPPPAHLPWPAVPRI